MANPFEGLLGNTIELRLLEFMLPFEDLEFNITELVEESGVSRPSVIKVVTKFVEWNIVKSENLKGVDHYSINGESPYVKIIEQFNNAIIEEIIEDETLYEINDYFKEAAKKNTRTPELKTQTDFSIDRSEELFHLVSPFNDQRERNIPVLAIGLDSQSGGHPNAA